MKQILVILILMFFSLADLNSQSSTCEKYRKIMDQEMDALEFDDFSRQFIIGKDGEYYKPGMSKLFISEPKIPDFGKLNNKRNPHIVAIEIAHVNLYHCDVEELKGGSLNPENKINDLVSKTNGGNEHNSFSAYPNPTNGIIQLKGEIDEIESINIFQSEGRFIAELKGSSTIDLSNQNTGTYLIIIYAKDKREVHKIVKN